MLQENEHQDTVFKLKALKYTNVCIDTSRGRRYEVLNLFMA